jgi:ketosteroid isomerase-like protein
VLGSANDPLLSLAIPQKDARQPLVKKLGFQFAIVILAVLSASNGSAQSATVQQQAEAWIRKDYAAWNQGDQAAIVKNAGFTVGFGFRTLAPRGVDPIPPEELKRIVKAFFDSMEYYHIKLHELHTKAYGDVVVAWGFHTEDFRIRGKPPEVVRVRFTATLRKTPNGWQTLISHRDIQPFDKQGRYIPDYGRP